MAGESLDGFYTEDPLTQLMRYGITNSNQSNSLFGFGENGVTGSPLSINPTSAMSGGGTGSILDGFFRSKNPITGMESGGYGQAGLGLLQGLGGAYLGMKQYGLAKDALKTSKEQFAMNYGAQKNLTNSMLEDRQNARNAANPNGNMMATADYMQKYGVK